MKVLIVVDKSGTAIDRLAKLVQVNHPYLDIKVLPVHPKRNDVDTMYEAVNLLKWCDVIDIHYWKSGEVLKSSFPAEFNAKPKLLFHFNPYDYDKGNWGETYDKVIVGNMDVQEKLPSGYLIPYGLDVEFFKFNENYVEEDNKVVNMVVGRIESKKGVLQVAQACKDLGYELSLVGRVSNGQYMQEVLDVGSVTFIENATEDILLEEYSKSAIHICNSEDGFETGTLPILEAMCTGVPVLTRSVGHVPDLYNGKNMVGRSGTKEDVEDLKKHLKEMMDNYEWRRKLRENGWDTARTRDSYRMTGEIVKMYYKVFKPNMDLVSVIMPTKDNPKAFVESVIGVLQQNYEKIELVVVDSGDIPVKKIVDAVRKKANFPVKYIRFDHKNEYTLAKARNLGVIESDGEVLVFCDDRIKMEPDAVTEFVSFLPPRRGWVWGVKDNVSKGFVENFSAVRRKDLIESGMFCERVQWYGGTTQEIRTRFEVMRGFNFILVDKAKAKGVSRTSSKNSRRKSIILAKRLLYKMYGN